MMAKFIDDGMPESRDFDDNYVTGGGERAADAPPRREWRERKILGQAQTRVVAPKDVRFFQWMECRDAAAPNHWKRGFLRRLL